MNRFNERDTDITERLDEIAQEVFERDRTHGVSMAGMLNDAKKEIERLRAELKKEMFNSYLKQLSRHKRK